MISFVIPSHRRADGTAFMIASLLQQSVCQKYPCEIILSIDESDPETAQYSNYLVQLEGIASRITPTLTIKLLINKTQGLVAAKNAAVKAAKYDYIMMLDDDLYMEPTYVEQLLTDIEKDPAFGAVSGFIVSYVSAISHTQPSDKIEVVPVETHLQTLKVEPNNGEWRTLFGQKEQVMDWSEINKNMPKDTRFTMDYFVNSYLFRKTAFETVHGYSMDLNSKTSAHEEVDFTYRIRKAGFKLLFNPFAGMWHITVGHGGIYKGKTYTESKQILEEEYTKSVPVFMRSITQ